MYVVINHIRESNNITTVKCRQTWKRAVNLAVIMVKEQAFDDTQPHTWDEEEVRKDFNKLSAFYHNDFTVFIQKVED